MITKPTLLIDELKCRYHINDMVKKAERNRVIFRPHFKTHQSVRVGRWFRDAGVEKITVSSVDMATYFAEDGWKDITIAFPVNILEIEEINKLAGKIQLNVLVESAATVEMLSAGLEHPVDVFIKIELGKRRTGIDPQNIEGINEVITRIQDLPLLKFAGFLGHAGHSYLCENKNQIRGVLEESRIIYERLRKHFGKKLIYSFGDTPTCSVSSDFTRFDEIRPGNFVFYDLMMAGTGACSVEDISVTMACPVVAKHPDRNEVVIYGGAVHFSKDSIRENEQVIYGKVAQNKEEGWGDLEPDVVLDRISQEHGILKAPSEWIENIRIGDVVKILPVHSCLTVDLMRHQTVQFL